MKVRVLLLFMFLFFISCHHGEERTCCDGKGGALYCNNQGLMVCADGTVDGDCPCRK